MIEFLASYPGLPMLFSVHETLKKKNMGRPGYEAKHSYNNVSWEGGGSSNKHIHVRWEPLLQLDSEDCPKGVYNKEIQSSYIQLLGFLAKCTVIDVHVVCLKKVSTRTSEPNDPSQSDCVTDSIKQYQPLQLMILYRSWGSPWLIALQIRKPFSAWGQLYVWEQENRWVTSVL